MGIPTVEQVLEDTAIENGRHEWQVDGVTLYPRTHELQERLEEAWDPWNRRWMEDVRLTEDDIE